jgi:hypothetical protein
MLYEAAQKYLSDASESCKPFLGYACLDEINQLKGSVQYSLGESTCFQKKKKKKKKKHSKD